MKTRKNVKPLPAFTEVETRGYLPAKLAASVRRVLKVNNPDPNNLIGMLILLVNSIKESAYEVNMWRSLWCDQPEDRLYHAKDRTWWRRYYGPDPRGTYTPYGTDPPPEIMLIVRAARKLSRKSPDLKKALSYFPD